MKDLPYVSRLLGGIPFPFRNWTGGHPLKVAGSPIVHLRVEVIRPIWAVPTAEYQDGGSDFRHLLEVPNDRDHEDS